ncbi:hypothetical protein NKR19_g4899 [Coniochaeta hoffmannii]|uniref:LysM domain-containing protein n=1 Tax=Coniochaeta hoffmannii TaxID=91930 RepID=A0AA38VXC9_9PEZI|nr:hypothetical protein NKR19_g4899 [Coniochaeta hoffmannii]
MMVPNFLRWTAPTVALCILASGIQAATPQACRCTTYKCVRDKELNGYHTDTVCIGLHARRTLWAAGRQSDVYRLGVWGLLLAGRLVRSKRRALRSGLRLRVRTVRHRAGSQLVSNLERNSYCERYSDKHDYADIRACPDGPDDDNYHGSVFDHIDVLLAGAPDPDDEHNSDTDNARDVNCCDNQDTSGNDNLDSHTSGCAVTVTVTAAGVATPPESISGASGASTTTSTIVPTVTETPTGSSASSAPSPTQPGATSGCKQWYRVTGGDTCDTIVEHVGGFTLDDFYMWNPSVGRDCRQLWLGYYVCVSV